MKDLRELLEHELKDIYSAEKQITAALPKVIEAANDPRLKSGLESHLAETEGQIGRLETIFKTMGINPGNKHCKAMEGLIAENESMLKEDAAPDVLDAAIIAGCQKIEHYEISAYGTVRHYAQELGIGEATELLEQTLEEEKGADDKLNDLAIERINKKAEAGV